VTAAATPGETRGVWATVELARHERRPYALDLIVGMCRDFFELHGDRAGSDDRAIVGGPAMLGDRRVMIVGQQKGRDAAERARRNWGMAHPQGYRKAVRLMQQAERFRMPVLTLVDTPGAYPGVEAERAGQAWAIAESLHLMSELRVPVVAAIIGEGGSGGALALALADRVLMLENAIYSVASPEACAAITWRDSRLKVEAAEALRVTAADALRLGVIDEIVPEPRPAHEDPDGAAAALAEAVTSHLDELSTYGQDRLLGARYWRFRRSG
jgi:acetyl-CoA carboxylase carboxyl transferase subunit alpha